MRKINDAKNTFFIGLINSAKGFKKCFRLSQNLFCLLTFVFNSPKIYFAHSHFILRKKSHQKSLK